MLERSKAKWGYLFILPNFLGFMIFTMIPVFASMVISFCNWDIVNPMKFVGFENYISLFHDDIFVHSLLNTLYFTILTVPLGIILALFLAVLLNTPFKGVKVYRTIAFLPVITSMVSIALVWSLLYDTDSGIFNQILNIFGIKSVEWLTNTKMAMISLAIMSIWKGLGYNMTIYIAGLQGIPQQLYEAAKIDGANAIQRFFNITVPLLSPTTYFITVMSVIGALQVFDQAYILTSGGPADSTKTIVMYLYNNAFQYLKMGYASSMAYILFLIIFVISFIQSKYSKKWAEFTY